MGVERRERSSTTAPMRYSPDSLRLLDLMQAHGPLHLVGWGLGLRMGPGMREARSAGVFLTPRPYPGQIPRPAWAAWQQLRMT